MHNLSNKMQNITATVNVDDTSALLEASETK